jgi:ELWxxDGT repeat protein
MKGTMSFIGAIALLIMSAPMPLMVRAQTSPPTEVPVMVKDIFPGSGNSIAWLGQFGIPPGPFAPVGINGILFFRANDGTSGIELWSTDGTETGTFRVKDIVPGAGSSSPQNLVESGGLLFFKATDSSGTVRLWRSDGTEAGTLQLGNLNLSSPDGPVDVGGTVYFTASDGTTGQELWRSDGTQVGTTLVSDINPGFFGSGPASLTSAGGMLFFVASDNTGRELWRSDGTAAGTFRVKDIFPNNNPSSVSSPDSLTPVGGLLFFRAYDGIGTLTQLWRSDGTAAGTFKINNVFMPGLGSTQCATSHSFSFGFGGTILFAGYADATTSDFELWRSDGTADGAFRVKDINSGSDYSFPHCFV